VSPSPASPWYRFCRGLARILARILWGLEVVGADHVPASGPLLVTSNHVSLLDPPVVASAFPREVCFAAKRELFGVPGLGPLIRSLNSIPVDRARVSVATIREFGRAFDRGLGLLYFPEGTRSRTGAPRAPKIGVGMVLAKYPVTVVPVHVSGTDSLFRCLIRRERVRVTIGRPYTLPGDDDPGPGSDRRSTYRRTAEAVMDRIRRLDPEARTTDDRETVPPAEGAARSATSGSAASGRQGPNPREGMETQA
jgi:1-acyl-sn-glycerol-3-phosphate acyltransferase